MNLSGVFAPIPTPFTAADRLDTARLRRAVGWWLAHPLAGIVVLGTSGEAPLLDDEESDRAIAACREVVPRGRVLVAGTGRESTQAAIGAARRAAALGVDAVLVRTPGFFKNHLTDDAFVRHYVAVADASPVPVLLYSYPAVTGVSLSPAVVSRLAAHPNIVGMKDSSGDVPQLAALVQAVPGLFPLLTGSGSTFHAALSAGAAGGILALACVLPDACVRLFELARAGQDDEARALQARLLPMARLLGAKYGVPGLKAAMALVGDDVGVPRLPVPPATDEAVAELRQALTTFDAAEAAAAG